MNNKDMPAMLVDQPIAHIERSVGSANEFSNGLTKREHFAGLAMQGMMSNSNLNGGQGWDGIEISSLAVQAADSLLKALEANDE